MKILKKLLILAGAAAAGLSAQAFPTYEPFTEFANTVSSTGSNMVAAVNGVPLPATGIVGDSAVLQFSQDIPRPGSGVKTVFVSYLFYTTQQGQMGAGNDGRYMGFLCQTNLVEGHGTSGAYQGWTNMFNAFGTVSPKYATYAGFLKTAGASYYLEPCDAGKGLSTSTTTFYQNFGTPVFVVGAYQFSSGTYDTNAIWINPSTSAFGGANPPTSPVVIDSIASTNKMTDIGGLVLIDRPGSGALGGMGTNYVANLLIGTTWSYVTGGPEFTNQPASPANVIYSTGSTVSWTGAATAAAQSVSYQWQHVVGSTTNNLTDGAGTAGGAAHVSGSLTGTLTVTGISAGDTVGYYQLVATASGTSYQLASQPVSINTDPSIVSNPASVSVNAGTAARFTATFTTLQSSLSYQWFTGTTPLVNGQQADGSTVSGASGTVNTPSLTTTLILSNVTYLEEGIYSVVVTNSINATTTSGSANLVVNDPFIATQPVALPLVLSAGGSGSFSVTAAGSGLTYQWYGVSQGQLNNGANFAGATTATLTVQNAQLANSDYYYCIISGASGAQVQTINATLLVDPSVTGPFDSADWPASAAQNANVDFRVFDGTAPGNLYSTPSGWQNDLSMPASGGDQTWVYTTLSGESGNQLTGTYLNILLPPAGAYTKYTNDPVLDILLSVYGNSALYSSTGAGYPTVWTVGSGAGANGTYIHAGAIPNGGNNSQWNWILLSITNAIDGNGYPYIGDPTVGSYGGVNNGTLRLETGSSMNGVTVRAIAIGPHGAFGTPAEINRFAAPPSCAAEPTNNLAWIDFNQGISNNLSVLNNPGLGESYTVQSGAGPASDLRTAIQSSGMMEMPILNNYLGQPCNENLAMQVCIEFYDDPALAGSSFGPMQYATDYQGDESLYPGAPYTLTGSGQWLKVAFYVGPLNLEGINTSPLTGGPVIQFNGTEPYIDRIEVGVIRTGTNALAGQIPDPNYYLNPLVYGTNNGYYAEWYPSAGIINNLDLAADYFSTLAGPANDQRISEIPNPIPGAGSASYMQWTLLNDVFGANYQDNADVIISMTYYDDPALAGNDFYPNVYSTLIDGATSVISPASPYNAPVYLQGSGKWQEAVFELPNVNFQNLSGNGLGQNVCRFASSAPISISRLRCNVLRPTGPFEGIDYLQTLDLNSSTNAPLALNWRGTASVQSAPALTGPYGSVYSVTNTANNVYPAPLTNNAGFFRLQWPAYPSYLNTNQP
jgi:hypothetical protein